MSSRSVPDAQTYLALGLGAPRTIKEAFDDPKRPRWQDYKKKNLDVVDESVKENEEYRAKLDRVREARLRREKISEDTEDEEDDDNEESDSSRSRSKSRSKKKKKNKKRKRTELSSDESSSSFDSEDDSSISSSDSSDNHHKKHKDKKQSSHSSKKKKKKSKDKKHKRDREYKHKRPKKHKKEKKKRKEKHKKREDVFDDNPVHSSHSMIEDHERNKGKEERQEVNLESLPINTEKKV